MFLGIPHPFTNDIRIFVAYRTKPHGLILRNILYIKDNPYNERSNKLTCPLLGTFFLRKMGDDWKHHIPYIESLYCIHSVHPAKTIINQNYYIHYVF